MVVWWIACAKHFAFNVKAVVCQKTFAWSLALLPNKTPLNWHRRCRRRRRRRCVRERERGTLRKRLLFVCDGIFYCCRFVKMLSWTTKNGKYANIIHLPPIRFDVIIFHFSHESESGYNDTVVHHLFLMFVGKLASCYIKKIRTQYIHFRCILTI